VSKPLPVSEGSQTASSQFLTAKMRPDDMLETFSELAVKQPDLMRLTLHVCVAALVNVQRLTLS
jgi:hypothetical protein